MKNAKKIVALLLCAVLLVGATIAGTLAYMTAQTSTVKNTFTVGKVELGEPDPDPENPNVNGEAGLDEAKVNQYGELLAKDGNVWAEGKEKADRVLENVYKLIPGHAYVKDPIIHVGSNSEDCWLFVKVENGLGDNGTISWSDNWTRIKDSQDNDTNYWAYRTTVSAGADIPVFTGFTFSKNADPEQYKDVAINVTAYAIQADGIETSEAAWAALKTELSLS